MTDLSTYLDDLCVRFLLNVPPEDRTEVQRLIFMIEEAHWFYEDFVRPTNPSLRTITLRNFSEKIFAQYPMLLPNGTIEAYEVFAEYKSRVPVRGAIMLNSAMDKVVLVKAWRGSSWSFPRGKIAKDEDDLTCAVREVYEETGYHLEKAGHIPQDRDVQYLEVNIKDQQILLYVFAGIPDDAHFETRTRKEISKISWWKVSDLPAFKQKGPHNNSTAAQRVGAFYNVASFLPNLRKWITAKKQQDAQRVTSNQYASAGLSNDEYLTEEDAGAGSGTQLDYPDHPEREHMSDATATLSRLLNIGEPSQEQDFDVGMDPQRNQSQTGTQLLALLQNKHQVEQPRAYNAQLPHTPSEHNIESAHMPETPHHHHPAPPSFSSMPPPPNFPILQQQQHQQQQHYQQHHQYTQQQQQHNSFSYQQPNIPYYPQPQPQPRYQQYPTTMQPNVHARENHHHYQSQHLIHPQPLPPTVQKALFTGGPVHSPIVPQAQPVQPPVSSHYPPNASLPAQTSQTQGLHAPLVPPMRKESPPKLTKHSLALLDAFKRRDQDVADATASKDLPLRAFAPEQPQVSRQQPQVPKHQPQELLADLSQAAQVQPQPQYVEPHNHDDSRVPIASILPSKQPISDTQKSALLDLFKGPVAASASPKEPLTATAFPPSVTPSAVELSAVEPLSSNAAITSALLNDKRTPDRSARDPSLPELQPEANLPYRAMTILSRPPEMVERAAPVHNGPSGRTGSKGRPLPRPPMQEQVRRSPEEKKFQPQILKRPQPGQYNSTEAPRPTQPQVPLMQELTADHRSHPSPDHRQNLLSMFGKSQGNAQSPTYAANNGSAQGFNDPSMKSRVGSLASSEVAPRKQSQAPMSPADTSFLLDYLAAAVAKGH